MALDNSKQESGIAEELDQEEVALSSSELDNIISSAEIRSEDGDSEDENLEQYGIWVKVEPEKIETSPDESPFELADLEGGEGTELTDEEEELLGELESDLAPELGGEEPIELEAPEESTPEGEALSGLEGMTLEEEPEEAEIETLPDLESELELLAEEEEAEDLTLPAGEEDLEEAELELPLSEDTALGEPLEDLSGLDLEGPSEIKEESAAILKKIEQELQSIKEEIHNLKKGLSSLTLPRETPEVEPPPVPAGGFFAEEEDETIALTGDELDNILNTADITEESTEAAAQEAEPAAEMLPEAEEIEITIPDEGGETVSAAGEPEITEAEELEDLAAFEEESPDLEELSLEEAGLAGELEAGELEIGELEAGELEAGELEIGELEAGEPEAEAAAPDEEAFEELEIEEMEMEELEAGEPEMEELEAGEPEMEEPETEAPSLEELELPDLELAGEEEALTLDEELPELTLDTEEAAPALDEIQLEEVPAESEAPAEDLDLEIEELEELSAAEDMEEVAPAESLDELGELGELEELEGPEELPGDAGETATETPAEEVLTRAGPVPAPTEQAEIPVELRTDIKSVLSYLDQLLESLPEEKIREFANSEYFGIYKKLFDDLGLEG